MNESTVFAYLKVVSQQSNQNRFKILTNTAYIHFLKFKSFFLHDTKPYAVSNPSLLKLHYFRGFHHPQKYSDLWV